MYGLVKRLFTNMMVNLADLLEARINGRILGAFISKDVMNYDQVEDWIKGQEEDLFFASGYLKGLMISQPWLFIPMAHYTKAQGIATCYYKLHWRAKVYIIVEGTIKNPKKISEGFCTCLESPKASDVKSVLDPTTACYPDE